MQLIVLSIITEHNTLELQDQAGKKYYLKIKPTDKASDIYKIGQTIIF